MIKVILLILSPIALMLTSSQSGKIMFASDGYVFQRKEYQRDKFEVEVIYHKDRASLRKTALLYGLDEYTLGFVVQQENLCVIHIVDADFYYEPEIYGHELSHCMYGKFHD